LRQGVNIDVSQKVNLNFSLQVGIVSEEVTVKAEAVGVNTADASNGSVMDPDKIQNLPLNGRQVYQLLPLLPGTRATNAALGASGAGNSGTWGQTMATRLTACRTV